MADSNPLPPGALGRGGVALIIGLALTVGGVFGWLVRGARPDADAIDIQNSRIVRHSILDVMHWMGDPILECPIDMWEMQEVFYKKKPDVLIEAGTYKGGSALYFANLFDLIGKGRVITIDVYPQPNLPKHPRITYLLGSSTSIGVLQKIEEIIRPGEHVMVFLDSDHHTEHVLNELRAYSHIVTVGDYIIVADTTPRLALLGQPGLHPEEAVASFLSSTSSFVQDWTHQKWGYTDFPGGWLKRVR